MFDYWHDNPPAPFNPSYRPGFGKALSAEYAAYCEANPDSTQEERKSAYREIAKRLEPKFPPVGK